MQNDVLSGTLFGMMNYGVRIYDPVTGRWHVVDPLDENEYNMMILPDIFNSDDFDEAEMVNIKTMSSKIVSLFAPNTVTAETSAIRYAISPYAYVLNNPLKYIDRFGLDPDEPEPIQLPDAVVVGKRRNNDGKFFPSWMTWTGGSLIASTSEFPKSWLGKANVGSTGGTNLYSVISRNIYGDVKMKHRRYLSKSVFNPFGKRTLGSATKGAFIGRLATRIIAPIGAALIIADIVDVLILSNSAPGGPSPEMTLDILYQRDNTKYVTPPKIYNYK